MMFDYFYAGQADLFTFYRIPKNLITDKRFTNLSTDAKLLYGLMLDRMGLSAKNGWCDEHGRVYIVFSIEEVMEALNVKSNTTACKYMAELDTKKGIGLIERIRLGQGQKDRIYVLNFSTGSEAPEQELVSLQSAAEKEKTAETKEDSEHPLPVALPISVSSNKYISRSLKNKLLEKAPESGEFQKFKNCTSGSLASKRPEVQKINAINDTDFSYNKLNNTMLPSSHISQSINTGISMPTRDRTTNATPRAQEYLKVRCSVAEQIEADTLKEEHGDVIDDIVELITDVMITQAPTLRVAGVDREVDDLRGLFFRLSAERVETALWNLRKYASSDITDKKAYMRTLLYDAMLTMNTGIYQATKK